MAYPLTITKDSVSATLYLNVKADGYKSYCLCWYEHGQRKRRTFTHRKKALQEADKLLTNILAGTPELATLSVGDAKEFAASRALIEKTGLSLVAVCREFMRTWTPGFTQETVKNVIAMYENSNRDASKRYRGELKYRLNAFRKKFGTRYIDEISGSEVRIWIEERKFKGRPAGNRTRSNWLRLLKGLWNYARVSGHLVRDRRHNLEDIRGWKFNRASYSLMPAGDLTLLLEVCNEHKGRDQLLPFLALQAWGGLRNEEAKRLTYENLVIRDGQVVVININANQTKTGSRRSIDVLPALASHLHEFAVARHLKGKIATWSKVDHILRRAAKKAGLVWSHNQLRHTCATHLLRLWDDTAKVATYIGTSPAMLNSNYRELTTPDETAWWFSLREENPTPVQPVHVTLSDFVPTET
ncbi:MAG: site-specific integrase [Verrucomicrobia bacterium]|nr:site-specific integrase [Verrucomicrobiota bacterium]